MTDEYSNKIKNLLQNVLTKTEKIVEPEIKPESKPKIEVKSKLKDIFKIEENHDVEQCIGNSSFYHVKLPTSYKDAEQYWKEIKTYLEKIGPYEVGNGKITSFIYFNGNKTKIEIFLVRDSANNEKPYMLFKSDGEKLPLSEVIETFKSVGLNIHRTECKDLGDSGLILSVSI